MRYLRSRAGRLAAGLAAPLVLAGGLAGLGPAAASAATCVSLTGASPVATSTVDNTFTGVTEISPCDVWAAGFDAASGGDQTLTEHWDGSSWTVVPSPSPGADGSVLEDVRAVSANDAWAVGSFADSAGQHTLALHWNGSQWSAVPSPSPAGTFSQFRAVRAVSSGNVWAVGSSFTNATGFQTVIEHWNGSQWSIVPSPNPGATGTNNTLSGLAVTSASNAWAVGTSSTAIADHTLILHWDGTSWQRVPSPTPDGSDQLRGAAATSASNAWAVGASSDGAKTVILRWNGTGWQQVASPSPTVDNGLFRVAATSASNAWAVGFTGAGSLILAWDGKKWAQVPSPPADQLNDIAAKSASNAWTVGAITAHGERLPVAFHCC